MNEDAIKWREQLVRELQSSHAQLREFGSPDADRESLPANTLVYSIYFPPVSSSEVSVSAGEVQSFTQELLSTSLPDYIWNQQVFGWTSSGPQPLPSSGWFYLRGQMQFGDSVEDEWLAVWVLSQVAKRFPKFPCQMTDNDGQFLLIELAEELPEWVEPRNSEHRLWMVGGNLRLLPRSLSSPTIPEALDYLSSSSGSTLSELDRTLTKTLRSLRLDQLPEAAMESNSHFCRAILPRQVAKVLMAAPSIVAPVCRTFCDRDHMDLRSSRTMAKFRPDPPSTGKLADAVYVCCRIRFTRLQFAQLQAQQWNPPPYMFPMPRSIATLPDQHPIREAFNLGIKLACGLEMLYQRLVRSVKIQEAETKKKRETDELESAPERPAPKPRARLEVPPQIQTSPGNIFSGLQFEPCRAPQRAGPLVTVLDGGDEADETAGDSEPEQKEINWNESAWLRYRARLEMLGYFDDLRGQPLEVKEAAAREKFKDILAQSAPAPPSPSKPSAGTLSASPNSRPAGSVPHRSNSHSVAAISTSSAPTVSTAELQIDIGDFPRGNLYEQSVGWAATAPDKFVQILDRLAESDLWFTASDSAAVSQGELTLDEQFYQLPADDPEEWMNIAPNQLQQMLERYTITFQSPEEGDDLFGSDAVDGDSSEEEEESSIGPDPEHPAHRKELQDLVSRFKDFLETESDFQGVEVPLDKVRLIDPDEVIRILGADVDGALPEDAEATARTPSPAEDRRASVEEEKETDGREVDTSLQEYMDAMDLEISGKERSARGDSELDAGEPEEPRPASHLSEAVSGVDLDLNLVQNLLESYSIQGPGSGPASNIINALSF